MPPSRRVQKQAIARLHQMACLDCTGPQLIASVLRELRHVVAFDSGGYFHPGDGDAPGGYVENPCLRAVMPDYFDAHVQRSEGQVLSRRLDNFSDVPVPSRRKPSVLEPGQLLAVSRAELLRSDYYEAIMRPADLSTWVALLLHDSQGCALGKLALFRHGGPGGSRPFSPEELTALGLLEPCLSRLLQPGEIDVEGSEAEDSGLLIVTPQGRLLWLSPEAERLLPLAFGWRWRRAAAEPLPHALQLLLQRMQWVRQGQVDAPLPEMEWHNAGGWFSLRATQMTAADPGDASPAVALHITQRVARGARLLAALQSLTLPPRQHALAYWMAQGRTESQIAVRLGLSTATVVHHRRALYERLGVQDRSGLLARLPAARPNQSKR